jgi:hypothetical protein
MILNSEEVTNNLRKKIEKWKDSLADLTKNNPLIQFRTDKQTLEIIDNIHTVYTDILQDKKVFFFDVENPDGGRIKSVVNELTTVQTWNEKLKYVENGGNLFSGDSSTGSLKFHSPFESDCPQRHSWRVYSGYRM